MEGFCATIRDSADGIMEDWQRLARAQPWYCLPGTDRSGLLRDVLLGLVDAAICEPSDESAHRRKVSAAWKHGQRRRAQGVPEHLIFNEYHLLRQALWYYLITTFGPTEEITDAIMRVDVALTVATNASLWGYHKDEIDALGRWDEGMERIVQSSPLLNPPAPS
jgi:hypothetical protein